MEQKVPRYLAAFVWYAGALILSGKAMALIIAAAPEDHPWTTAFAVFTGIGLGILKGTWLFTPACRRNLARIAGLADPRPWHAFRPRFWLALMMMILLAGQLSRWIHDDLLGMLAVAALDFSIATALWVGGRPFWQSGDTP